VVVHPDLTPEKRASTIAMLEKLFGGMTPPKRAPTGPMATPTSPSAIGSSSPSRRASTPRRAAHDPLSPDISYVTDLLLPIFPLGVVLLPGTLMPLHLFEPRYRQMLADVREGDRRFGIIAAIPGVAERDLPAGRMGCVAEVTDVEVMPDGRANIIVMGRERFALDAFVEHDAPYHVATGTFVTDENGDSPVALAVAADEVIANFKRVVQAVRTLNDVTDPLPELPDDAAQVAWSVGAMIDLDLDSRYRLLAERSPAARLTQIDNVLRKAIPDLELQAAIKTK